MNKELDPVLVEEVLAALAQFNEDRSKDQAIPISLDASLGMRSGIDSLGLIMIFSLVEERIRNRFGISLALLEEEQLLTQEWPLETVESFITFLQSLIPGLTRQTELT